MKLLVPVIETIDDVRPFIADKAEIVEMHRDGYIAIDYVYSAHETFNNQFARECRGLKFDPSGKLIGRAYHKFHNLNENEEYQANNIDFAEDHVVLDKLDGSMIHTAIVDGVVRLMTRKGITDVALKAETYLIENPIYMDFFSMFDLTTTTLIFEYVAPHNRIVIFYPEEKMILTAIRDIRSGAYIEYNEMVDYARAANIPVVGHYAPSLELDGIRGDEDKEGVVVRFASGAMVKIKSEIYCKKHGAVDSVSNANGVIELTLSGLIDDILPDLSGDFKDKVIEYRDSWLAALAIFKTNLVAEVTPLLGLDQKTFALTIKDNPNRKFMFEYRKTNDIDRTVDNYVISSGFKPKRFEETCVALGLPHTYDLGRWDA